MNLELIIFIVLALTGAISAVGMITRPNPVISALFLIFNFFALAGLYLLLNAQFISIVQIIVYAGAIMVLFLFVIMLLRTGEEPKLFSEKKHIKYFAIVIAVLVFVQLGYLIFYEAPSEYISQRVQQSMEAGTIENIGQQLYTTYMIPFEAAGFLLLAATIGALVLAKKNFE
ncbi:MAG: NADH-quinone oxidoreductase subunit J [Melioribacteraceae bacterium]|nr:NADH-quinone oxidoreductase subunit J [Melioribacteraceae bacterium]MCF8353961.1 NADH-quinone oxidoreductase subunit J [Melioribacteraceae bacterium]MCF8393689.1 NADH-quinone oxidoreductase subunit J [Melioribacteraceae bacterium]MCF8419569.1 NADH-quinone oxidoreductase subunit J [Melioribacteraceae bacterium]